MGGEVEIQLGRHELLLLLPFSVSFTLDVHARDLAELVDLVFQRIPLMCARGQLLLRVAY
jgi:hypothetical protein